MNTIAKKPVADLVPGDHVEDGDRSFTVTGPPETYQHFLLGTEWRVPGERDGKTGYVMFGLSHTVRVR